MHIEECSQIKRHNCKYLATIAPVQVHKKMLLESLLAAPKVGNRIHITTVMPFLLLKAITLRPLVLLRTR